jgi:hypothetical protein
MIQQTLKFSLFFILILLFSFQCERKKKAKKNDINQQETTLPSEDKPSFSWGVSKGILQNEAITEASGLAASRNNKGLFWTHNDSKDASRLFLFDGNGADKGTFLIEKVINRDWEDLEMVTIKNTPYIYVADIGDNDAKHEKKYIYKIKEPKIAPSKTPQKGNLSVEETIVITYPDAKRNAEALMIDQKTFDIYIVSKSEDIAVVYHIPYPQSFTNVNVAKPVAKLPISLATAATISLDNQEILIKNTDKVFYWKRKKDETIIAALTRPAIILPYVKEPQGEAIAFAADGSGYYTVSEIKKKVKPHLYFYKRN